MEDPRRYMQISDAIRRDIADGKLVAGQKVPSIDEIRVMYGVGARQTAAKALRHLESINLLVRFPGLGYYVVSE